MGKNTGTSKARRILRNTILSFLGLWAVIIIALQLVLSDAFLEKIAKTYLPEYVDAEVKFSRIHASMFSSFPKLHLDIDSLSICYPHERFSAYDSLWIKNSARHEGRGEKADTLLSFNKMGASVHLLGLLKGSISLPTFELDGLKLYAHKYSGDDANWNITVTGETPVEEPAEERQHESENMSVASSLPSIIFKKINISGNPKIVFTSSADSLFASIHMDRTVFDGKVNLADLWNSKLGLDVEKLSIRGRTASDTLAFNVNCFSIHEKKNLYDVSADADALVASDFLGTLEIPINFSSILSFHDKNYNNISFRELEANIATMNIKGEGDVVVKSDSTYLRAEISVHDCPIEESLKRYAYRIMPESLKLRTDAKVSLTALCDGWYIPDENSLPTLLAEVVIPKSSIAYEGIDYNGKLGLLVNAETDNYGNLTVLLNEIDADIAGVKLYGSGSAEDLLGEDPLIGVDLEASASLDTINSFMPEGISAEGNVRAALSGFMLMSDMSMYNFTRADLDGYITSDRISFSDVPDSLYAYIDSTDIRLGRDNSGEAFLLIKGKIDSINATLGESTFFKGRNIGMQLQNSRETVGYIKGREIHPIVGKLSAGSVSMSGADSLVMGIRNTQNVFSFTNTAEGSTNMPTLWFTSDNEVLGMRQGISRMGAKNASFNASAVRTEVRNKERRKHFLDSLSKVYPGVARDSLIAMMVNRTRERRVSGIEESDLSRGDLDLSLNESLRKYLREWKISGRLDIPDGTLITPYFPIINKMEDARGYFDNNRIALDNMLIKSGSSDLLVKGEISGIRKAVYLGNALDINVDISSKRINANELLHAYVAGSRYTAANAQNLAKENSDISNEEYMHEIESGAQNMELPDSSALIIVPGNINAKVHIEGEEINYSDLQVDWFESDIMVKNRTLQITNTVATSNMGDIYMEGFYSTRNSDDISAGFNLNMASITADKVITLYPAVDSLMPMLKSFKGMLDCEISATTMIDQNMNFIPNSINGVLNISGSDLSIQDNGGLRKLARLLMFKDKKIGRIKDMSVQGVISNSTLEIFPFVMGVDRYLLAMDGTQNFDQSFRYHVSVLKSPLPFRFGINLSGNFDKWSYKIGKARYKDADVPVFTSEIKIMQTNLLESIHNIFNKGIDAAMKQSHSSKDQLDSAVNVAGYNSAAREEELDSSEMEEYNRFMAESEAEENSVEKENITSETVAEQ